MPPLPYRQSPRLKDFDYLGPLTAHVVLVTRSRQPILSSLPAAQLAIRWLEEAAAKYTATIHAYCFMPDHMHILVEIPEGVSLQRLIRWYKQMSGYCLKQIIGAAAWQVSYYDHVLRKEEAIEDVARYVWNNPVVDGIADDWTAYPLSGPRETIAGYGAPSQV